MRHIILATISCEGYSLWFDSSLRRGILLLRFP